MRTLIRLVTTLLVTDGLGHRQQNGRLERLQSPRNVIKEDPVPLGLGLQMLNTICTIVSDLQIC